MKHRSPIIVALDGMSEERALVLAGKLKDFVWGFKVTDLLFDGVRVIRKLKKFGKVFADAKLCDIPNTVGNSVGKLSSAGADLITVHASGGVDMMRAAKRHAGKSKIIAVTVLTSTSGDKQKIKQSVLRFTKDAIVAGVDGVVCSGDELALVGKLRRSHRFLAVVPGIRPTWYNKKDDQRRSATPWEAIRGGAQLLVIGRPITGDRDPVKAIKNILSEIDSK